MDTELQAGGTAAIWRSSGGGVGGGCRQSRCGGSRPLCSPSPGAFSPTCHSPAAGQVGPGQVTPARWPGCVWVGEKASGGAGAGVTSFRRGARNGEPSWAPAAGGGSYPVCRRLVPTPPPPSRVLHTAPDGPWPGIARQVLGVTSLSKPGHLSPPGTYTDLPGQVSGTEWPRGPCSLALVASPMSEQPHGPSTFLGTGRCRGCLPRKPSTAARVGERCRQVQGTEGAWLEAGQSRDRTRGGRALGSGLRDWLKAALPPPTTPQAQTLPAWLRASSLPAEAPGQTLVVPHTPRSTCLGSPTPGGCPSLWPCPSPGWGAGGRWPGLGPAPEPARMGSMPSRQRPPGLGGSGEDNGPLSCRLPPQRGLPGSCPAHWVCGPADSSCCPRTQPQAHLLPSRPLSALPMPDLLGAFSLLPAQHDTALLAGMPPVQADSPIVLHVRLPTQAGTEGGWFRGTLPHGWRVWGCASEWALLVHLGTRLSRALL